jgi:hypothetical protein
LYFSPAFGGGGILLIVGAAPGCGGGGPFSVSFLVVGVGCNGAYLCVAAPVGAGIAGAPGCAGGYEVDDVNVVVEGAGLEVYDPSEA